MKAKLTIMAALCAIVFTSNAQTQKGQKLLGGSINFNTQTAKGNTKQSSTSLNIGPQIGFFIANNLVIGTRLNYSYYKMESTISDYYLGSDYYINATSGNISESYGVTPFARYYVNITDKFKFYGQFNLSANFGAQKMINALTDAITKSNDFQLYSANLNPGLAFFITKNLGIELSIPLMGYTYQNYDDVDSQKKNSTFSAFTFAASTAPTVGINFHF